MTFLFHGDLYECLQNTTFSLNQTQTNILGEIVNCTLLQAGSFPYSEVSLFKGVLGNSTVNWLSCVGELRVYILALALIFMGCPGLVCNLPADRLSGQVWR